MSISSTVAGHGLQDRWHGFVDDTESLLVNLQRWYTIYIVPDNQSISLDDLLYQLRARRALPPAHERQRIRQAAGISQRELAKAIGASYTSVQRWEAGATPRTQHFDNYARALRELRSLTDDTDSR